MIVGMPIDIIRKLIVDQLGIEDSRVMIYNGQYNIPPDDKLFVYVEYRNGRIISNRRTNADDNEGVYQDAQYLNVKESIVIGIFSKNTEALLAKEAIVMALNSYQSQSLQESNSFKIFPYAPIDNLSELEGSAQLYRFDISLSVFAWYRSTTPAKYFNALRVKTYLDVSLAKPMEKEFTQPRALPIL